MRKVDIKLFWGVRENSYFLLSYFLIKFLHAAPADGEADGLGVGEDEGSDIADHTGEIAATACARHLPGKYLVTILVDVALYRALNHGGEHGGLCIKGCFVG